MQSQKEQFEIVPFGLEQITPEVIDFCDSEIGRNYYTIQKLKKSINLGIQDGINCSYLAYHYQNEKKIIAGIRISYAPGQLFQDIKKGLSPKHWNVERQSVAYFKSLFVGRNFQQQGLGQSLSNRSLEQFKKLESKAVLCHSWLPSPGNASLKYLKAMGFQEVNEHKNFWYDVDYHCPVCLDEKCICPAMEMVLYL